jgi:4a-hydroxytetrahydrobiopterin dehydratase
MAVSTLDDEQRAAALERLDGWSAEGEAIVRTFRFTDFVQAMDFVGEVAELAEERRHHPDIDIRYNKVTLRLSSHDAGGVTERDIGFAEAVGRLIGRLA